MPKKLYVLLGHLSVGLAIVGAFLPVMPTMAFLIAASACYAKGDPRLKKKLLAHPKFGPPLRDWEQHRVVSLKAKLLGIALVTVGIGASLWFGPRATWIKVVLLVIWAGVVGVLLGVKTKKER